MAGCRRAPAARSADGATAGAGDAAWTLVYDQVVGGNQDLYTIPSGGGVARRLTDDPAHDMLPRFTHDGRGVLFASDRSGKWQIWEVPAEGGAARRVRATDAIEYQVDESPDGRTLAFLSNENGPESLRLMPRAGGAARVLVRHGANTIMGNPDWSADGSQITFSSNWRVGHQIYVDRGHLGDTSLLTEIDLLSGERKTIVDWPALNYDPAYSPDGREIAFASNITGEYAIYRQRLSDGRSWRVTHEKGDARYPDYRPDR